MSLRTAPSDLLAAVQFLTRIPVPTGASISLPRALPYFPLTGLLIGAAAAAIHTLLAPHLPRILSAFLTVTFVILLTGALHEDGLADSADGFGGGRTPDRILAIMRDSRIGSYGALALVLSVTGRITLIAALPIEQVPAYLIASHMLCRWTALPLSHYLPAARLEQGSATGLGGSVARTTSLSTLLLATAFTLLAAIALLRTRAIAPILLVTCITAFSAVYYRRRIRGITGDCFGATNQLAELGVYLCGVWT